MFRYQNKSAGVFFIQTAEYRTSFSSAKEDQQVDFSLVDGSLKSSPTLV